MNSLLPPPLCSTHSPKTNKKQKNYTQQHLHKIKIKTLKKQGDIVYAVWVRGLHKRGPVHNNNNITLLPSVNTLISQGMFCGAKYTHHTFTPIIKHLITTANKHPGKKVTNPTGIKLCISHKIKLPLPEDPLLKVTVLVKAIIRIIYNKLIN